MSKILEAIYEGGVLKPLVPLNLQERSRVRIMVEADEESHEKTESVLELARRSYQGLTEEDQELVESARLNSTRFFSTTCSRS